MARLTRAESSDDDDYLENVNSQVANRSLHNTGSPAPGTPSNHPKLPSDHFVDLTNSSEPAHGFKSLNSLGFGHSEKPVFGKPGKLISSLKQKAANASHMFIQPRNRPELHRDQKLPPRKPTDSKPQTFSSVGPESHPPEYVPSSYYKAAPSDAAFEDNTFYTDPAKANEDLKALLEGGLEDDEEEENKGDLEDGTLEGIKVKLLPHQVEGVKWMKGRELGPVKRGKVPKGGILADVSFYIAKSEASYAYPISVGHGLGKDATVHLAHPQQPQAGQGASRLEEELERRRAGHPRSRAPGSYPTVGARDQGEGDEIAPHQRLRSPRAESYKAVSGPR